MTANADPYAVLGLAPGADDAAIHTAYRAAVRRTHPDAGGSSAEFEAVQEAYEALRHPEQRRSGDGSPPPRPSAPPPPRPAPGGAPAAADPGSGLADLIAESKRLEDEARKLAGLPPRHSDEEPAEDGSQDSFGAILRDAGDQLLDAARDVRRRLSED